MTTNNRYDCIVIGAGISGLVCAIRLAKARQKVLVIEKNNGPGGLCKSLMVNGAEIETTLHHISNVGEADAPKEIRSFFENNKVHISWLKTPHPTRLEFSKDETYITLPSGFENICMTLEEIETGCSSNLLSFFNLCDRIATSQTEILKLKDITVSQLSKHRAYIGTLDKTLESILNEFGFSKCIKNILTSLFFYCATPPDKLSFTTYACFLSGFLRGTYVCEGFAYHIVLALIDKAESLGIDFMYNTTVKNIFVKGSKCRGVKVSKGDYYSTNYIICSIQQRIVYENMVSKRKIAKEVIKDINSKSSGFSSFNVFLILDDSPQNLGIYDYSVFSGDTLSPDEIKESIYTEKFTSYYNSVCLNYANPKSSPEKTASLTLSALVLPKLFSSLDYRAYLDFKNEKAKELIDAESKRLNCNLYDHILEIKVLTPVDYFAMNGSYQGNVFGYQHTIENHILTNFLSKKKNKYVKNLFFANSCGILGAGIANGIQTSIQIVEEISLELEDKKHENK